MNQCYLRLLCALVLLLSLAPFTGPASAFGLGEPFLLGLNQPLWTDRKLRHKVLERVRREWGVEIVHPLPKFKYVAVKVREGEKKRRRMEKVENVTVALRTRVGTRHSRPSSSLKSLLQRTQGFHTRDGKWTALS